LGDVPSFRVEEQAHMKSEDEQKLILRELVHALNEVVSTSESIRKVVRKANAAGFNISLSLDGTIAVERRTFSENAGQDHWLRSMHVGAEFEASGENA
jgi:hypothetical protein